MSGQLVTFYFFFKLVKKACNRKYFEWLVVYNVIVAKNYVVKFGQVGQLLVKMILILFL